ncbi:MAG: PHP domain-containing protein [Clostridiales bacterium]|jgi:predicted metal-dependent phosphoesterase TrpH|nr:PHP domain-containing protein [Clostridiales bacterium]
MIDLHMHSTESDGQYKPSELVLMAKKKNLSYIALTDHDTIAGLYECELYARENGIRFLRGIEISVKGNRELHILGYGVDPESQSLLMLCDEFVKQRGLRAQRILDYLDAKGVHITLEQVMRHSSSGSVGRPHVAQALVEVRAVTTVREAFELYLGTPEFDKIERPKPEPGKGISAILNSGGIAILAHPALLKIDNATLEKLVYQLVVDAGLGGIECYYSTHTKEQTEYYLSLAKKFGLVVSGGSDFHGEKVKANIALGTGCDGMLSITEDMVSRELLDMAK